jgi:hypothetical protein
MNPIRRQWREGKVGPIPGNSPHDRLVSRGILSPETSFRRSQAVSSNVRPSLSSTACMPVYSWYHRQMTSAWRGSSSISRTAFGSQLLAKPMPHPVDGRFHGALAHAQCGRQFAIVFACGRPETRVGTRRSLLRVDDPAAARPRFLHWNAAHAVHSTVWRRIAYPFTYNLRNRDKCLPVML